MQSRTDDADVARAIVAADIEAIRALRGLLMEEREALDRREPETLNGVVQRKLDCLQRLQRNEQERARMLARHRGAEWHALLLALDPALAGSWEALRTGLAEVAELTRVNERIVARTRRSSERLLALLRGQGQPVGVYDRAGQAHSHDDKRAITSA
jgi:flagellar biosynthesis/type III secretory pathway chaperone